jgi:hypothetical protein
MERENKSFIIYSILYRTKTNTFKGSLDFSIIDSEFLINYEDQKYVSLTTYQKDPESITSINIIIDKSLGYFSQSFISSYGLNTTKEGYNIKEIPDTKVNYYLDKQLQTNKKLDQLYINSTQP